MPRRKDAIFAKVDCKILHAQLYNQLRLADRAVYLGLWILAVRERTALLPCSKYGASYVAYTLHVDCRTCRAALARIAQKGLIDYLPDESIIVKGVMECHEKLEWKQVHLKDI